MKRGTLVTVSLHGDLGKPRPAVVVQSDLFPHTHGLTIIPLTRDPTGGELLRVSVQPTTRNGLRETSHFMTDKVTTVPKAKAGTIIGELEEGKLSEVTQKLALFLGLA